MFSKSSRYRNLPESSPVNAQDERLRGKELRLLPPTPGRFLHTVHENDRLDLLAFKYYGDTTRWWQISDANPEWAFPPDLLDRGPAAEELLVMRPVGFAERVDELRIALSAFGEVHREETSSFDETVVRTPEFLEATLTVIYTPSPHGNRSSTRSTKPGASARFTSCAHSPGVRAARRPRRSPSKPCRQSPNGDG